MHNDTQVSTRQHKSVHNVSKQHQRHVRDMSAHKVSSQRQQHVSTQRPPRIRAGLRTWFTLQRLFTRAGFSGITIILPAVRPPPPQRGIACNSAACRREDAVRAARKRTPLACKQPPLSE
jgi:hypothetical protein